LPRFHVSISSRNSHTNLSPVTFKRPLCVSYLIFFSFEFSLFFFFPSCSVRAILCAPVPLASVFSLFFLPWRTSAFAGARWLLPAMLSCRHCARSCVRVNTRSPFRAAAGTEALPACLCPRGFPRAGRGVCALMRVAGSVAAVA